MDVILAIDSASAAFALALLRDGEVTTLVREGGQNHSRLLIPAIQELLEGAPPLTGIVVVRGPGSYAGVRVGLATATALALARGIPLAGLTTFEALAAAAGKGAWLGIHPAGRGTFATQRINDGTPTGALQSTTAAGLAADGLTADGPRPIGEGAASFAGTELGPEARVRGAAVLGAARLRDQDISRPEALYLREPNITAPRKAPIFQPTR